jgi:ATP-binding cassette, subfamily C, bacterial LapB
MAAFLGLVLLLMPLQRRFGAQASRTRARRHAFLVEMLGSLDTVKECAGESAWMQRYRDKSSRAAESNRKNQFLAVVAQTLGNTCMLAAGAATIGVGTLLVLDGSLTVGALVASMALVWRVLSPLQLGLTMLPRLEAALRSLHEINGLMRLVPAAAPRRAGATHRVFSGRLRLSRASLRYRADDEPAVLGVDLDVRPGELVALIGPNGSGKSSLLKLAAGLYAPLAGTVTIDGLDLRQLDPTELRGAIAYLPQRPRLFFGTIAQNLRLAAPAASDEELELALGEAGALDEVRALPGGLRAKIGDEGCKVLPAGLVQRLALASIYLRDCPVLLFDEPGQTLDERGDADLMAMLARMKGKKTMLLVTHRPSHLKLADRVVRLDGGRLVADGPARDLQRHIEERVK